MTRQAIKNEDELGHVRESFRQNGYPYSYHPQPDHRSKINSGHTRTAKSGKAEAVLSTIHQGSYKEDSETMQKV